jgi:hypothetical protein
MKRQQQQPLENRLRRSVVESARKKKKNQKETLCPSIAVGPPTARPRVFAPLVQPFERQFFSSSSSSFLLKDFKKKNQVVF